MNTINVRQGLIDRVTLDVPDSRYEEFVGQIDSRRSLLKFLNSEDVNIKSRHMNGCVLCTSLILKERDLAMSDDWMIVNNLWLDLDKLARDYYAKYKAVVISK